MPAFEEEDGRLSTVSNGSQSYGRLVWQRLRKSVPGILGLGMVCLMLTIAFSANFFAPLDPNAPGTAFAPPDTISWHVLNQGCS